MRIGVASDNKTKQNTLMDDALVFVHGFVHFISWAILLLPISWNGEVYWVNWQLKELGKSVTYL